MNGDQYECLNANLKWTFAPPSRGGQIAEGIKHTRADLIWVLHADSSGVKQAMGYLKTMAAFGQPVWGRFDIQLHWPPLWFGVGGSNDELAFAFDADMHR